jgi:hypothetical protein
MTDLIHSNSDNGDILRSITWQYDKAEKLVGAITLLKEAFDSTTKDFFDSLPSKINIDTADEFGLSVLGKTLGIPRPTIVVDDVNRPLDTELYRRIIKGRTTLLNSSATMPKYIDYLDYVSDGKVKITVRDGLDMGLTFTVEDVLSEKDIDKMEVSEVIKEHIKKYIEDIKYLNSNYPDILYVFPSGVRSSSHSNSPMFGLGPEKGTAKDGTEWEDPGQKPVTEDDPKIGMLNECGFNWRLTPKGNWQ